MKRLSLLLLFLLAPMGRAEDTPYSISVEISPGGQITIGDEVKLLIRVDHDASYTLSPPPDAIVLKPFEFKRARLAPPKKSGNRITDSLTVVCSIFELGRVQIPRIPLTLTDSSGLSTTVYTAEIPIEVKSVLKDDPKDAIMRPIKGPVSVDLFAFYRTLIWPAILVLILTLLFFWMRRLARKNKSSVSVDEQFDATMQALAALRDLRKRHHNIFEMQTGVDRPKSAYHFEKPDMEASDEAMVALLDLQDQKLLSEGLVRQFHGELSHIFRHYVGRRFSFPTFEKTTTEISTLAVQSGVTEDVRKWMHAILDHCDFAKFSPADPTMDDCDQVWKQCWEFVLKTRPPQKGGSEIPPATGARAARSSSP